MKNNICYMLLLAVMAALFLFGVKIRDKKECSLDRDTTNVLKGYSIAAIIIHHMVLRMSHPGILLPFRIAGYLGVTIFFFLSGYGLVCAARGREKKYSRGFMLKRFEKIYVPALAAQVLYMLVLVLFFDTEYSAAGFVKGAVTLYPVDTSQWYIIAAFFWYIAFWLLIKFVASWKKITVILFILSFIYIGACMALDLTKNWMDTAFCFPLGVAFAVYKDKLMGYINKYIAILPVSLGVFGVTVLFSFGKETNTALVLRMISTAALLLILLTVLRFVDVSKNKIMAYIGIISLECYLVHGKTVRIVKLAFGDIGVVEMCVYLAATAVCTAAFVFLVNKYSKIIANVKK